MKKILLFLLIIFTTSSFLYAEDITQKKVVENFFKENTDLRIAEDAVDSYRTSLNEISSKVIKKAAELAKQDNRKTILQRDIDQATEEIFRQAPMTIAELMEKIKLLSIIDLAELANQVNAYADQLTKSKK